jgi:hypothetical protein
MLKKGDIYKNVASRCRVWLRSVERHFALLHCHFALSHCHFALLHCRFALSSVGVSRNTDHDTRQCNTTLTMRYDTRLHEAIFYKMLQSFSDFYTATPDNAKRHSTMRGDIRQCEATFWLISYRIVLRLPVTGQNIIPHLKRCDSIWYRKENKLPSDDDMPLVITNYHRTACRCVIKFWPVTGKRTMGKLILMWARQNFWQERNSRVNQLFLLALCVDYIQ